MKRIVFILLLLMALSPLAYGQRWLPKENTLLLGIGPVDGFLFRDKYGRIKLHADAEVNSNRNNLGLLYGVSFLQKDILFNSEVVPAWNITGNLGMTKKIIQDRKENIRFDLSLAACAGYEIMNGNKKELSGGLSLVKTNSFVYGLHVGAELSGNLSDRCALFARLRQRFLIESLSSKRNTGLSLGVKYTIN